MAQIPLNLFRRQSVSLSTSLTGVYQAPIQRAGIIINALASNLTNTNQTITLGLSTLSYQSADSQGNPITIPSTYFDVVKGYELAPNNATNVVINKLVMFQGDILTAYSGASYDPLNPTSPAVNLTLSILEAVNIP
jgi:hypothetical protein